MILTESSEFLSMADHAIQPDVHCQDFRGLGLK